MHFKFLFFVILTGIALLSLTAGRSSAAAPKADPIIENLFNLTNIEEIESGFTDPQSGLVTTGWGEYEDIIIPGTDINGTFSWVTTPQTTGKALRCEINDGRAYNNYYCVNNLEKLNGSIGDYPYNGFNQLELEFDFYVDGDINCDNSIRSDLEGVEFTWQFTQPPQSYGFGIIYIPWRGQLRHWTATDGWANFDPPIEGLCIEGNRWHHVKFESSMLHNRLNYHTMTLNGDEIDLHNTHMPIFQTFPHWKDTFLQVGFQLDSTVTSNENTNARPVGLLIDNVNLVGNKVTFVFDHSIYLPAIVNGN